MRDEFVVYPYSEKMREEWDDFVLNQSINGTFLHTRRFLNYHPRGRFVDTSLVIKKGDRIISVVPACEINGTSGKEFFSHKGSTYGGPIIDKKY